MPTWLVFTLIAIVLWSVSQILVKKGFANISPLWNNIFSNFFKLIIWVPATLLITNFQTKTPSLLNLIIIVLVGVFYMFFFYALSKGQLALMTTLIAMGPMVTTILSLVFLHEALKLNQAFGVGIILFSGVLLVFPDKKLLQKSRDYSWVVWGGLTAIFMGTGDFLTKISTNMIGAPSHLFYLSLILPLISLFNFLVDKSGRRLPKITKGNLLPTLLGTSIMWVGSLLFFLAFDYGPASLISPVASTFSIFTVLLAVIFLKEKITKKQMIGVVLAVVGVMLVARG